MAFYQQIRTAKAAAIGTIMPWTGGISTIPKGWIFCDGAQLSASNYPLLARAIGDTYNNGPSTFSGSFPNYTGNIVLPNLANKNLIDIESSYFGPSGIGNAIDSDAKATTTMSPLIGENTDTGIKTVYNDVTTDVVFSLNDRVGFTGKASGNAISGGEGVLKTVYVSPRKLGRNHIKPHNHPGRFETLSYSNPSRPGSGVIPYSNFSFTFTSNVSFDDDDLFVASDRDSTVRVSIVMNGPNTRDAVDGFGLGRPGRVVAGINAENPSFNYTPKSVRLTPLAPELTEPGVDDTKPLPYGINGANINIPFGYKNYYPDLTSEIDQQNTYDTLSTPPANEFTRITQTAGVTDVIQSHTHDEFDVEFIRGTLRANTSLSVEVDAPNANLSLDNQSNKGALQINFNTTQPGLTCIYIIRAY